MNISELITEGQKALIHSDRTVFNDDGIQKPSRKLGADKLLIRTEKVLQDFLMPTSACNG